MKQKILIFSFLLNVLAMSLCEAASAPALPPPIPGTDLEFYAAINGKQAGPFDMVTLRGMVQTYQINSFTLVWREGMDAWTQASLVPELQPIFGKKFTIQSSPSYQPGSSNTPTFAEGGEYNPDDIQSIDPNKPLTDKEQKFIAEKLHGKWHVNPSDKAAMKKTFFNNLAAGIALGVVGTTLQSVGAGVMGGLMSSAPYYGSDGYYHIDTVKLIVGAVVGANILTAGTIIGPLCAVPFVYAGHTGNIYKKTTGQKLFAAASRVSLGGGYDWENKEVQVAMAIRL